MQTFIQLFKSILIQILTNSWNRGKYAILIQLLSEFIESIYHYQFYEINILFLPRTYTGENHNESGIDRKNLTTTGQCTPWIERHLLAITHSYKPPL